MAFECGNNRHHMGVEQWQSKSFCSVLAEQFDCVMSITKASTSQSKLSETTKELDTKKENLSKPRDHLVYYVQYRTKPPLAGH